MTHRRQAATPQTFLLATLVGASLLAAAAACDTPPDAQYVGVCVDRVTQLRVSDDQCGLYDTGAAVGSADEWDYIDTVAYPTYLVPAYGRRINVTNITVVHTAPANVTVYRGAPRSGGTATAVRSQSTLAGSVHTGSGSSNQGTANSSIQRGGFGVPGGKTAPAVSAGS
jgi:hypothetical protein